MRLLGTPEGVLKAGSSLSAISIALFLKHYNRKGSVVVVVVVVVVVIAWGWNGGV